MRAMRAVPLDEGRVRFGRSRAHAEAVEGMLSSGDMVRKPHSDVEELLEAKGREWARLMYEEHLSLRAELEQKTTVVGADGVERDSTRGSARHLDGCAGSGRGAKAGVSGSGKYGPAPDGRGTESAA